MDLAGAGVNSEWIHSLETHLSFDADGRVSRTLVINLKNGRPSLWVLGPETTIPVGRIIMRLQSTADWNELVNALAVGKRSVTWWERGGVILRLLVSSSWEPSKIKTTGAGSSVGIGVGFSTPM